MKNTYNTKKLKPGLVAFYNIRPGNGVDCSGRMGKDGKAENRRSELERET